MIHENQNRKQIKERKQIKDWNIAKKQIETSIALYLKHTETITWLIYLRDRGNKRFEGLIHTNKRKLRTYQKRFYQITEHPTYKQFIFAPSILRQKILNQTNTETETLPFDSRRATVWAPSPPRESFVATERELLRRRGELHRHP